METLYVKELSRLTRVSTRTLHYYDKIGLLKPSNRLTNGYRVYTQKDLVKLEKIIALKFFGFTLARIKQIVNQETKTLELLETQLVLLQSEATFIQEAQRRLLSASINEYRKNAHVDWHAIVTLISEYTQACKDLKSRTEEAFQQDKIPEHKALWQELINKIKSPDSHEKF
jgi:DNA-binding transcriptional MerR regulator